MKMGSPFAILLVGILMLAVVLPVAAKEKAGLQKKAFGKTPDGKDADLYVLTNVNGVQASITNYGGIIVSLKVPDRQGNFADVVLGYDSVEGYVGDKSFQGAIIGRYGNRIGKGQFSLNGKTYTLPTNDGPNTLHGGIQGFNKKLWDATPISGATSQSLQLNYVSKDGEEGFPGTLQVQVTYTLTDKNELKIAYQATSDKDTIVNLTNHAYYNLAGQGEGNVLSHVLTINADRMTPVDATLIPTGALKSVKGTAFDFTKPFEIGARINSDDEQLKLGRGYDHNFVLNACMSATPALAATVYEPKSGRVMQVLTTEPGVQLYTGNFLDGTIKGKGGKVYNQRYAFCLETQHYPDSPNKPEFPTTELKAGANYQTTTIYTFSVKK